MYMLSEGQGKSSNNNDKCSPSSSIKFFSFQTRNYSSLQQMKNNSVVNNCFLRWCWYCFICSVWLIIYLSTYLALFLLFTRLQPMDTKAGRVVYFILSSRLFHVSSSSNPLFSDPWPLSLVFSSQSANTKILLGGILDSLWRCLHCPVTSREWKTDHSRGRKF